MGRRALVTGAEPQRDEVAAALRDRGFEVVAQSPPHGSDELPGGIAPGTLDCYVQLPVEVSARGGSVVERFRNFLADGLITRFDAAAATLPALAPGAVAVLVSGNHPPDSGAPDDQRARLALLHVLAQGLLIERGGDARERLSAVVVDGSHSPAEVAEIATEPTEQSIRVVARLAQLEPSALYDDWRDEIMLLTTTHA